MRRLEGVVRTMPPMRLVATLLLAAAVSSARDDRSVGTDTLFNTDMYVSPAKGESPSKGEWVVFHEGEGKPGKGYFMEHAPGEIAEFRLFVPKGLKKGKLYPLLIVPHVDDARPASIRPLSRTA